MSIKSRIEQLEKLNRKTPTERQKPIFLSFVSPNGDSKNYVLDGGALREVINEQEAN
jgi:hypothetical protein